MAQVSTLPALKTTASRQHSETATRIHAFPSVSPQRSQGAVANPAMTMGQRT